MVALKKDDSKKDENSNLPVARIRIIMKSGSDPDITHISNGAAYLVTKATELFIKHLAKESYKLAQKKPLLSYDELSEMVQKKKKLEFLHQIVPRKMTVREIRKLMAKESDDESTSEDESGSDDDKKGKDKSSSSSSNSNSGSSESSSDEDEQMKNDDIIEIESTTSGSGSSVVECITDEVNSKINKSSNKNKK